MARRARTGIRLLFPLRARIVPPLLLCSSICLWLVPGQLGWYECLVIIPKVCHRHTAWFTPSVGSLLSCSTASLRGGQACYTPIATDVCSNGVTMQGTLLPCRAPAWPRMWTADSGPVLGFRWVWSLLSSICPFPCPPCI